MQLSSFSGNSWQCTTVQYAAFIWATYTDVHRERAERLYHEDYQYSFWANFSSLLLSAEWQDLLKAVEPWLNLNFGLDLSCKLYEEISFSRLRLMLVKLPVISLCCNFLLTVGQLWKLHLVFQAEGRWMLIPLLMHVCNLKS